MFYMGTNNQMMQGGKLVFKIYPKVKGWMVKGRIKLVFSVIDLGLGYLYIIWKVKKQHM